MSKPRTLSEWSAAIKKRDEYRCVRCFVTTGLVAHHIKPKSLYPELKFDLDNGETLCVDCHKEHHKQNPMKTGPSKDGKVSMRRKLAELDRQLRHALESNEAMKDMLDEGLLFKKLSALERAMQNFERAIKEMRASDSLIVMELVRLIDVIETNEKQRKDPG